MKNIFYCSNAQSDIFPRNTRSTFDNYIDINNLNYLPDHDIEATIKSITFDNKRDEKLLKEHVLAIRTNICEYTIRNGEYDKIISLFVGNNIADVVHVDFKNPPFFTTQKELLSRAHFEIIDVNTNTAPDFAIGSPTYIQVVVRKRVNRMKKPFTVFLDSSCKKSKSSYPENNSMEFTIDLPERLEFRENWHVVLKSLFIPNKFVNADYIYIKYFYYNWSNFDSHQNTELFLKPMYLSTVDECIEKFNRLLYVYNIKIKAKLVDGKVTMEFYDNWKKWPYSNKLTLSPNIAHMLGFQKYDISTKTEFDLRFNESSTQVALYEPDLFLMHPRNLIIGCDVVCDTIFGGEHVKLLRLVTNPVNSSSDVLTFDFLQNEYVELSVKEFKSIKIRIADVTGKTVKCVSDIPSRLQLLFVNV